MIYVGICVFSLSQVDGEISLALLSLCNKIELHNYFYLEFHFAIFMATNLIKKHITANILFNKMVVI